MAKNKHSFQRSKDTLELMDRNKLLINQLIFV